MGRGRGGYTTVQPSYKDSGGKVVKDAGAIFVAERYIEMGYESVFRRVKPPAKTYDLTIKSSNDEDFIKNIEVKRVTSSNPSKLATEIKHGMKQLPNDGKGTVAIYLPNHTNNSEGVIHARKGFEEALRKGWINGHVEVWFNDKTKLELN
ncbi:MAG: hypothetical protein ACI3XC_08510 [Phascolarctobacterium sp.]